MDFFRLLGPWRLLAMMCVRVLSFHGGLSTTKFTHRHTTSRSMIAFCGTTVGRGIATSDISTRIKRNCGLRAVDNENRVSGGDHDKFLKRKVAFTLAYVGSKYHGLQMDPNIVLPTVEYFLEDALFRMGCIRESNRKILSKIQWSRSSRTDKGVHCARLVISAKLEIDPRWLPAPAPDAVPVDTVPNSAAKMTKRSVELSDDYDVRFPQLVAELNALLPEDIRVLSCCKMNQGFRAKEAATWREYEYLLPLSMIFSEAEYNAATVTENKSGSAAGLTEAESETKSTQIPANPPLVNHNRNVIQIPREVVHAKLQQFSNILSRFEGSQSFHNFHRLSVKALRNKGRSGGSSGGAGAGAGAGSDLDDEVEEAEEEVTAEGTDISAGSGDTGASTSREQKDNSVDISVNSGTNMNNNGVLQPRVPYDRDSSLVADWQPVLRERTEATRGTVFAFDILDEVYSEGSLTGSRTVSTGHDSNEKNSDSNSRALCTKDTSLSGDSIPTNRIDQVSSPQGVPFLRLRIRGQSFLLHQIRLMVGAAVLVSSGVYPECALDVALYSPYFVNFPMAPAEGLVLVNAGFNRNANRRKIAIHYDDTQDEENEKSTTTASFSSSSLLSSSSSLLSSSSSSSVSLTSSSLSIQVQQPYSLMTNNEFKVSEDFKYSQIYPKVFTDWLQQDGELQSSWLRYAKRFRVAPGSSLYSQWMKMAAEYKAAAEWEAEDRRLKEIRRLHQYVTDFRLNVFAASSEDGSSWDEGYDLHGINEEEVEGELDPLKLSDILKPHRNTKMSVSETLDEATSTAISTSDSRSKKNNSNNNNSSNNNSSSKKKNKKLTPVPHKKFLPNTVSTALVNRFRVLPGDEVNEVLRALATKIVRGEIPEDLSNDELCKYVEKNGGYEYFVRYADKHPLIE